MTIPTCALSCVYETDDAERTSTCGSRESVSSARFLQRQTLVPLRSSWYLDEIVTCTHWLTLSAYYGQTDALVEHGPARTPQNSCFRLTNVMSNTETS